MLGRGALRWLSEDSQLIECHRIAAAFGLKETEKAQLLYFDQVLREMQDCLRTGGGDLRNMKDNLADFVDFLSAEADHQFAFQIANRAIRWPKL